MFHSRRLKNHINHIHERALRIIYPGYSSSFTKLLRKDSPLTTHQINLKLLVVEMFKIKLGVSPEIKKDIFEKNNRKYNFRHDFSIKRHSV